MRGSEKETELVRLEICPIPISDMDETYSKSGVYFLWRVGVIVYVGQSKNMTDRIVQHLGDALKAFDHVSCLPCPSMALDKTERHYIEKFMPKYNRCSYSTAVRRTMPKNMLGKPLTPLPDSWVNAKSAADILNMTPEQFSQLRNMEGIRSKRLPRSKARVFSVQSLQSWAQVNA